MKYLHLEEVEEVKFQLMNFETSSRSRKIEDVDVPNKASIKCRTKAKIRYLYQ